MSKVKSGSVRMTVPQKIQFARQIVLDMTGNANFATPAPALASLTAAAAALEASYNTAQATRQLAKSQTSDQDAKAAQLDALLAHEADYVNSTANGDEVKIESSGFSVKNPPTPIGALDMVTNLSVAPSQHQGSANLKWKKLRGATAYAIERAAHAPGALAWTGAAMLTKSKASLNTMTSGQKYWFRVAGVGAAGPGPWSEPVSLFAP